MVLGQAWKPLPYIAAGAFLFSSVLLYQGLRLHHITPRFKAPAGEPHGCIEGENPPLHLIVLGESTVSGVGVSHPREALGGHAARVVAQESRRAVAWHAIGQNGTTARAGVERLVPRLVGKEADLVIVALGVNDVILMRSPGAWAMDMQRLLAAMREHLGQRVPILLSGVPPMSTLPLFPQPLRAFAGFRSFLLNRSLSRLARGLPATYHVPITMRADRNCFSEDGYHPSQRGYAQWAEELRTGIRDVLARHDLVLSDGRRRGVSIPAPLASPENVEARYQRVAST